MAVLSSQVHEWQSCEICVRSVRERARKIKSCSHPNLLTVSLPSPAFITLCAPGADPGFFLGGGALVSCVYFNTNKPHSFFFFLENTSCIRKPQVIPGGVRTPCTLPLDPPLSPTATAMLRRLTKAQQQISTAVLEAWYKNNIII